MLTTLCLRRWHTMKMCSVYHWTEIAVLNVLTSVSLSRELLLMEGLDSPLILSLSLSLQLFCPGFSCQTQQTRRPRVNNMKQNCKHCSLELYTWITLAREGIPQKSVHEYVITGRGHSAVSVNLSCFWAYSAAIASLANDRRHLISQYETPLSSRNREQGQRPFQNLQMEPLSFPSRHHMPRQQELSKCHLPDTLFEMQQNDRNNEDDVPMCEHLRPFKFWRTIKDSRECWVKWKEVESVFPVQVCDWCPLK